MMEAPLHGMGNEFSLLIVEAPLLMMKLGTSDLPAISWHWHHGMSLINALRQDTIGMDERT